MKKYIAILYLCLIFTSCNTSKQIQTIPSMKFKLPKEFVKITNENLNKENRKDKEVYLFKNIYTVNNILIGLSPPFKKDNEDLFLGLKKFKKDYDYTMKSLNLVEAEHYLSKLEIINGNGVLISYTFYEDIGRYTFTVINNDSKYSLRGAVVFENQSNSVKALKILYDLLKSLEFKE